MPARSRNATIDHFTACSFPSTEQRGEAARSAYLREARTEMPWEDLGVMRAMLAFRHTA